MNAREKLNSTHIAGSLIVAAVIGTATGSLLIFGGTVVVLVGLGLHDGGIRPKAMKRKR